jgi:hypothetical protein
MQRWDFSGNQSAGEDLVRLKQQGDLARVGLTGRLQGQNALAEQGLKNEGQLANTDLAGKYDIQGKEIGAQTATTIAGIEDRSRRAIGGMGLQGDIYKANKAFESGEQKTEGFLEGIRMRGENTLDNTALKNEANSLLTGGQAIGKKKKKDLDVTNYLTY